MTSSIITDAQLVLENMPEILGGPVTSLVLCTWWSSDFTGPVYLVVQ